MDNIIQFEKYGIQFSDEDFDGVDKETLLKCRKRLKEALEKNKEN